MATPLTVISTSNGRNAAGLAQKERLESELAAAIDRGRQQEAGQLRAELERLNAQVSLAGKIAHKHAGGTRGKERRALRKLA